MKDSELFSYIKNKTDWTKIPGEQKGTKVEYKVEVIDGTLYVLFQQSYEVTDWLSNLNFPATKYEQKFKFHRGFCKQYDSVKEHIRVEVANILKEKEYPITIAGWSLGAAISEIAAEDVFYHTGIMPTVVSFGTPKACFNKYTRDFIRTCCKDIREYCNKSDIVTYQPPIGYWHLNKIKVGTFNFFHLFNPWKYHTNYDSDLEKMGL